MQLNWEPRFFLKPVNKRECKSEHKVSLYVSLKYGILKIKDEETKYYKTWLPIASLLNINEDKNNQWRKLVQLRGKIKEKCSVIRMV